MLKYCRRRQSSMISMDTSLPRIFPLNSSWERRIVRLVDQVTQVRYARVHWMRVLSEICFSTGRIYSRSKPTLKLNQMIWSTFVSLLPLPSWKSSTSSLPLLLTSSKPTFSSKPYTWSVRTHLILKTGLLISHLERTLAWIMKLSLLNAMKLSTSNPYSFITK